MSYSVVHWKSLIMPIHLKYISVHLENLTNIERTKSEWLTTQWGTTLSRPFIPGHNPKSLPHLFSFSSQPAEKPPVARLLELQQHIDWTLKVTSSILSQTILSPATSEKLWNTSCNYSQKTKRENLKYRLWLHRMGQERKPREQTKKMGHERPQWLPET